MVKITRSGARPLSSRVINFPRVPVLIDQPNVHLEFTDAGIFHVQVMEASADEQVGSDTRPNIQPILDGIQVHLVELAPVYYLVGFRGMEDLTLSERWVAAKRMRENRYLVTRSAIYGLSSKLAFAFTLMIRVSGRRDLRVFEHKIDAQAWLMDEMNTAPQAAGADA